MDEVQRLVFEKLDLESERDICKYILVCKAWRDATDVCRRSPYHSYLRGREQVVESKLTVMRDRSYQVKVAVSLHVRFPEFEGVLHGLHCTFHVRNRYWTDLYVRVGHRHHNLWQDKLDRIRKISKRHNMPVYVLFQTQTLLDDCRKSLRGKPSGHRSRVSFSVWPYGV